MSQSQYGKMSDSINEITLSLKQKSDLIASL